MFPWRCPWPGACAYLRAIKASHDHSMIETVANSQAVQAQQTKPVAHDDIAPGFSFSAAMIALEGRASASLQTFGAAPGAEAPGQAAQPQKENRSDAAVSSRDNTPKEALMTEPRVSGDDKPQHATKSVPDAKQASQPPAPAQPQSSSLIGNAPTAIAAQPPSAAATARPEAAALRDVTLAKTAALKAPRPIAQSQASAPAQNFAHFLAKKLNSGATSFEMRLDPPQLGRVDAQLTIGDDGDAVVSLQFENQGALDLFARDEAALRTALSSSGHDFDQHKFTFSLRDALEGANSDDAPAAITASSYEPVFVAPFSTGAIDLRL